MRRYFGALFLFTFLSAFLAVHTAEAIATRRRPIKATMKFAAGTDAGADAGIDAGADAGIDAGDAGVDAGDVGVDAGFANVNAVTLDGVDESISVADTVALRPSTAMSICLWMQHDGATWAANDVIVAKYGASGSLAWRLRTNSSGQTRFGVSPDTTTVVSGYYQCGGHAVATKYHLCVTYDAGTVVQYRNGSAIAGCTISGTIPTSIPAGNAPFSVGATGTNTENTQITVDYVAYWVGTVLTAGNITTLYNGGTPLVDPSAAPYDTATLIWTLGEGTDTNTTFQDWTSGNYDGTGNNLESGDIAATPF